MIDCVDVALQIVAKSQEEALRLAEVILREHKPPELPEAQLASEATRPGVVPGSKATWMTIKIRELASIGCTDVEISHLCRCLPVFVDKPAVFSQKQGGRAVEP